MSALKNPLHERYAGQRAMGFTQVEAYRNANTQGSREGAKGGKNASKNCLSAAAARIEARPEVRARIAEIEREILESSPELLNKRQLGLLICDELRNATKEPGGLAASASLVDKYCKMFGLYEPEKQDVNLKGCLTDAEINERISALLGKTKN